MMRNTVLALLAICVLSLESHAVIWTSQEEELLLEARALYLPEPGKRFYWQPVVDYLLERGIVKTAKQCSERFLNHLDPTLDKNPFEQFEIDILDNNLTACGKAHRLINEARKEKGLKTFRSKNKVKNWCHRTIRRLEAEQQANIVYQKRLQLKRLREEEDSDNEGNKRARINDAS